MGGCRLASESWGVCQTSGKGMEMRWSTGTPGRREGRLGQASPGAQPQAQGNLPHHSPHPEDTLSWHLKNSKDDFKHVWATCSFTNIYISSTCIVLTRQLEKLKIYRVMQRPEEGKDVFDLILPGILLGSFSLYE